MPANPKVRRRVFSCEGSRLKATAAPCDAVPSLKFAAPRSVVSKRASGLLVCPFPPSPRYFDRALAVFSSIVHPSFEARASSSRELCASFEVLRLPVCPEDLAIVESAFLGVSSLIATSGTGVDTADSTPRPLPSPAFLTPSTIDSASTFASLFHLAATSRVCPSGVCSSKRSRTGFHRPLPSCRLREKRLRFDPRQRPPLPVSGPCSPR
jgi:hypothetical protein